jgi:DNA-directed RNA polymerase specialized sigma24 family protein
MTLNIEHEMSRRLADAGRRIPVSEPSLADVVSGARLPPRQRAAVVLRYYEGLGEDEIGQALHCSGASARSLLHRGLVNLRRQLENPES